MQTARRYNRNTGKPNNVQRHVIRVSLFGKRCMTCDLDVSWSHEIAENAPERATFGHVVPLSEGGTWDSSNIGVQCYSCNLIAGDRDLTDDIVAGSLCEWLSVEQAGKVSDVRLRRAVPMPDALDRGIARTARGLKW